MMTFPEAAKRSTRSAQWLAAVTDAENDSAPLREPNAGKKI